MTAQTLTKSYSPKKWELSGLQGISDETLQIHFGLYEGYVKNTNLLNERIAEMRAAGKGSGADPSYAELVRRLGWEFNGMRLHEFYFDNLTKNPKPAPKSGSLYECAVRASARSRLGKKTSLPSAACAALAGRSPFTMRRPISWSTYGSAKTSTSLPGCEPILVMDLWEHAWFPRLQARRQGQIPRSVYGPRRLRRVRIALFLTTAARARR